VSSSALLSLLREELAAGESAAWDPFARCLPGVLAWAVAAGLPLLEELLLEVVLRSGSPFCVLLWPLVSPLVPLGRPVEPLPAALRANSL
jgi:hypothetical protein